MPAIPHTSSSYRRVDAGSQKDHCLQGGIYAAQSLSLFRIEAEIPKEKCQEAQGTGQY